MNQTKNDEWRERIDALHEALKAGQIDFADDSEVEKVKAVIDDEFTRQMNSLRAYDKRKNTAMNDEEYHAAQRRKEALYRMLPEVYDRFGKKYPDMNLAEELIRLNAPATALTFDDLDHEYGVELAAAIRILDTLYDSDALADAAEFFPQTREELDSVYLPNLSDAVHSDDMLKAVIHLIRNRHNDGSRYAELIALIDADDVKKVQEQFIGFLWGFADSLLAFITDRRAQLSERQQKLQGMLQQNSAAPLMQKPQQTDTKPATVTFSVDAAAFSAIKELDSEVARRMADLERIYAFVQMIPSPEADQELFDGLQTPEIRCPYDMCFAYLTLLDDDNDCVWLYNLAYDILAFACRSLPWADTGVVDPDNTGKEPDVDYEYLAGQIEKMPDWDDNQANEIMYQKLLHSPFCTPSDSRISIAQLAFISSGLIPPRRAGSIAYTKAILHDTDLSSEQKELLYEYFSLAYAVNHRDAEYDDDDEQEDAENKEDTAQIKQLRSEIKHLRSVIHRFEQRSKETEKQLAEANSRLDAANNELAELRTMIRESCEADETEAVTVTFPYTAQKRSVIVGGHDSWVKAIRPLLDNVRFISSSEQPNPGVILNSEVVWLQTNALGHSGYYKIIDIVRRNHIKVCYFQYASAEKCAEQFALEDMAQDKPDEETND